MEVGRATPSASADPLRDEPDNVVEVLPGQIGEWGRLSHQPEQVALGPFLRRALRHDLLREYV